MVNETKLAATMNADRRHPRQRRNPMVRTRHTTDASIARTITSLTVSAAGPAEGELIVEWREYGKAYRAALRFRGEVYSGWGETEDGARRQVFENVAGLTGMLLSDVQTEFFGDHEEPISIRR